MTVAAVVGKGAYPLSFAARLTHLNYNTLKRWAHGYEYTYRGERRRSPARLEIQHGEGAGILSFLDLIEAWVIGRFMKEGVSLQAVAAASREGRKLLGVSHPFATRKLKTNGCQIFLEIGEGVGDRKLIEITKRQHVFDSIIRPFLVETDFGDDEMANRWWPIGKDRDVVVDPARSFGKPIINSAAVPTAVLAKAFAVQGSQAMVARWYEVTEQAVEDAVEFERKLAA